MTLPAGTVAENALFIEPKVSPAALIAVTAAANGAPTTFGTRSNSGVRLETTRLKNEPGITFVPAGGLCDTTSPAGIVDENTVTGEDPSPRPAAVSEAMAAACVSPTTLGTVTMGGGPEDTVRKTGEPAGAAAQAAGDWKMTVPEGTVAEACVVTVPTTNPALTIAACAAAFVSPVTAGTAAE